MDDLGWRDVGYMGSDFYETRNIDALAANGIRFTNAYSAAANCAPARASLLSGQYSPRHKIYNVGTQPRARAVHPRLEHIPGTDILAKNIKTWAQVAKLELLDNTFIIFFSDNGGYGPITDMDPLKGYKGTYYEGGIRVPLLMTWPSQIESGLICDEVVTGVDIYPTICGAMGVDSPANQKMDGVSLIPLLTGQSNHLGDRAVFWHFPAYLESYRDVTDEQRDPLFRTRPCSIIRKGNWKLHYYFEDQALELYDLENDIGETFNHIALEQEIANDLFKELKPWWKESNADLPLKLNPAFDPAAQRATLRSLMADHR